jgi:predicted ATPase
MLNGDQTASWVVAGAVLPASERPTLVDDKAIGNARILLLVNYRPQYSHDWGSRTHYTQLRLDPLGKESAEEMLAVLLGEDKDLNQLKHVIIERTQGTPFFIEEMVQALFEQGVLQRNGTLKLAQPISSIKVPPTVQAVLASRIDRLAPEDKELLQTLAVLGREFSLTVMQRVSTRSSDTHRWQKLALYWRFWFGSVASGDCSPRQPNSNKKDV